MIDSNPYVSGNANASNCIETEQYVLSLIHISEPTRP